MLCLTLLLPGKIGHFVRRAVLVLFGLVLIYAVSWGYIMSSIQFKVHKENVIGKTLHLTFSLKNRSFGNVVFEDMNLINNQEKKVTKKIKGFPFFVPRYSDKTVNAAFAVDKYNAIEMRFRTMGIGHTFKNNIKTPS
ncbi:hypothetical protein PAEPH01_1616 [Pancytospora epiphaga]|nr:hypothetical protein PAEPH01_1616 [Pancytospora epiphaga]